MHTDRKQLLPPPAIGSPRKDARILADIAATKPGAITGRGDDGDGTMIEPDRFADYPPVDTNQEPTHAELARLPETDYQCGKRDGFAIVRVWVRTALAANEAAMRSKTAQKVLHELDALLSSRGFLFDRDLAESVRREGRA